MYLKNLEKELNTTKNIVHLADSGKNEILAINKISLNLKMKRFEMPNAPY